MAEQKHKDPGVRLLARLAVTTVLWGATYAGAARFLGMDGHGVPLRILLVATAIGGFLPWVFMVRRAILAEDEFTQRIHLIAIAVTFALTGVASYACHFLERAGLTPELPFSTLWMGMAVVWWISIMATARYYR